MHPYTLLFVCTGNTCRSPMAEGLLHHLANATDVLHISSAGCATFGGAPASSEAIAVMAERDIDISAHRSSPLDGRKIDESDLIVVMTVAHQETVRRRFPQAAPKIRLLSSFGTETETTDIADPFGLSLSAYRRTRDEIESAVADLLLYLNETNCIQLIR